MRWILAGLLAAHGIAHLAGFALTWRLIAAPDVPISTRLFAGHVDVGERGIRAVGVLWLLASAAFVTAAAAVAFQAPWALSAAGGAVAFSILMCAAAWPESHLGFYVNLALVLVVLLGPRLGLFVVSATRTLASTGAPTP